MGEPMTVVAEVWPVAADETGLWLLSGGDALRAGHVVPADGDVDHEIQMLLWRIGITPGDTMAKHSTSWRPDGTSIILTYVAAVECPDFARATWPEATPITLELAEAVGKPPTHAANEPPVPRVIDVLFHGLGHFKYLISVPPGRTLPRNGEMAAALKPPWPEHLEPFEETLAGMYSQRHRAA